MHAEMKSTKKECTSRVHELRSTLLQDLLRHRSQRRPIFFLKTGPPGAGKSSVAAAMYKKMNVDPKSVVQLNIDDIVQQYTAFECAAHYTNSHEARTEMYFKYRSEVNDLLEAKLFAAMALRLHIEFETLGSQAALNWLTLLLSVLKRSRYRSVLVYTSVTTTTLKKRLAKRNAAQIRYVEPKFALKMLHETMRTFNQLRKRATYAMVIDNNDAVPRIIVFERK